MSCGYLYGSIVGWSASGKEAESRVQPHHVVPLKPVPSITSSSGYMVYYYTNTEVYCTNAGEKIMQI
jgi:hypothetical protein